MDANVNGLRSLLEHARRSRAGGTPVEGFLFFSTSEIYGDPDPANIPTPETYRGNVSCTGPRACYDERSEEHTSELQSLMRISYAVFCLKKKKNYQHNQSSRLNT